MIPNSKPIETYDAHKRNFYKPIFQALATLKRTQASDEPRNLRRGPRVEMKTQRTLARFTLKAATDISATLLGLSAAQTCK